MIDNDDLYNDDEADNDNDDCDDVGGHVGLLNFLKKDVNGLGHFGVVNVKVRTMKIKMTMTMTIFAL